MKAAHGALAALAAAAMFSASPAALMAQGPPPPGYYQGGPPQAWENPPAEYRQAVARQGFHDGIEGARKDAGNHRPPNVNNRDEYRHPSYRGADRRTYRQAFRRGYEVGVQHLMQRR